MVTGLLVYLIYVVLGYFLTRWSIDRLYPMPVLLFIACITMVWPLVFAFVVFDNVLDIQPRRKD